LIDGRCLQPDLVALIGLFRSRTSLQAEILTLRHQLNVLRRKSPKKLTFTRVCRHLSQASAQTRCSPAR
jgi:hypothetical protein